ncbi:hypothetical protein MMP74_05915 [Acinetobacter sp. NIPH 1869]|uniref:hypothetical protein n=1 Tax=Acinetobacter higginsii TaxID=70347 RepID=UPI001F4AB490|nr:hypothetical protein [Acinetobacter higginsii]MCH7303921.1 hypothetical protein [Acinetobacter higginsii]
MGKYKYFKIKTIKDWEGEYWDVYEEYKTQAGIMVYKGWPYAETPQNGGQANFYYILTNEIAEYITQHSIVHITKTLGFSEPVVRRFRKAIGFFLSHPITYNFEWILEHQDEILYDSYEVLSQKYGLTKSQIVSYTNRLLHHGIVRKQLQRESTCERKHIQWFQENKEKLSGLNIKEIEKQFGFSYYISKIIHDLVCQEKDIPTQSEQWQQQLKDKRQWLLDHQIELLRTDIPLEKIAQKYNTNKFFISGCRAQLREILNISYTQQKINWVKQHQSDLETMTILELQKKYQIGRHVIRSYRNLLTELKQNETHSELQQTNHSGSFL